MSIYDTFFELTNIWMCEGEKITTFTNLNLGLILADDDPNQNFIKHHFISKLLLEVQMPWAVLQREEEFP